MLRLVTEPTLGGPTDEASVIQEKDSVMPLNLIKKRFNGGGGGQGGTHIK